MIFEGMGFIAKPSTPVAPTEGRFEGEYNRRDELHPGINFKFHPAWRMTSARNSTSNDVLIDPREIYLEAAGDHYFLRGGFFTPSWEGTDGLNPMDIASVRDWSDPLRSNTLGSAGVQFGFSTASSEFEIFWVPRQTLSRLPGESSAWWPRRLRFPLRNEGLELQLPDQVDYQIYPREELNYALSNNAGLRWQLHGDAGDLAVGAFEGAAEAPLFSPLLYATAISTKSFLLIPPIQITPVDYRRRTMSGLISFPWDGWIFRAAIRHDQPVGTDYRLPGWSEQAIAGFEKSFDHSGNTVTLIFQGSWGRRADDASLLSVNDLFDRAILAGVRWPLGEFWTVMISGFRTPRDGAYFFQSEISRRFSDSLRGDLFSQVLNGPPESLLGILGDRDRAGARLTYAF